MSELELYKHDSRRVPPRVTLVVTRSDIEAAAKAYAEKKLKYVSEDLEAKLFFTRKHYVEAFTSCFDYLTELTKTK